MARRWGPVAALFVLLVVVLARTAWISDDALISLRVVVNLQDGWGPRWNVLERVQVYTHPLWFLLMTAVTTVTREYWVTVMALGALCSLGAAGRAVGRLGRPGAAAAFLALLVSSTAWVDYATSGLENSLGYVLVVALACAAPGRRAAVLAGLALWTRLDLALLVLPLLAEKGWPGRREAGVQLVLVALFPGLWMLFSALYYGSPLPNTYYAKLGAAIPAAVRWSAGAEALEHSLVGDPVAAAVLLGGLGVGLARRQLGAVGLLLYPLYWVSAGGDFMLGRFLAVPVVLAALRACEALPTGPRPAGLVVAGALALGLAGRGPNLLSGGDYTRAYPPRPIGARKLMDERAWYYGQSGWLAEDRPPYMPPTRAPPGPDFVLDGARLDLQIGHQAWRDGPRVHVVDVLALGDPLLARLPARRDREYRPGHLERVVPPGYVASLLSGENRLVDPALRGFLDQLWLATRAPLGAPGRARAVAGLLLGWYDHLVVREAYLEGPEVPTTIPGSPGDGEPPGIWGGPNGSGPDA